MTDLTNKYKPFLIALRDSGATADLFKHMILAQKGNKTVLFTIDLKDYGWNHWNTIFVESPSNAVKHLEE